MIWVWDMNKHNWVMLFDGKWLESEWVGVGNVHIWQLFDEDGRVHQLYEVGGIYLYVWKFCWIGRQL